MSEKRETVLFEGDGVRTYCAFPSLIEDGDGILCAFKLGTAHMKDEGAIAWISFRRDGTLTGSGRIIPPQSGLNYQNVELLRFPDGSARYFVDVQDPSGGKQRLGMIQGVFRDGEGHTADGIVTDTAGTPYGYAFDAVEFGRETLLLAMTFPELPAPEPRKSVEILASADGGTTWRDALSLDALFGAPLNESTLCVLNGKLYVLSRSYGTETYAAVLDGALKTLRKTSWGEAERIVSTGRPKLFVKDGDLYGLFRNHETAAAPMDLLLVRIDPETLAVTDRVLLDTGTKDGYYAEPYFDGGDFCVVTYKQTGTKEKPSIVLLRYGWNELWKK